jgi:FKBP-type peptidyl-prolyl cis-trans isomerase
MKSSQLFFVVAPLAIVGFLGCERKPNVNSDKAKLSYAVGASIAQNIKSQNIELDPKVVGFAVEQSLKGDKPAVSAEDQQKAIQAFQQAAQTKATADAERNKQLSAEYLTRNKARPEVKTTASGLQYEVLKEGAGPKPTLKSTVRVHYTGTLITGQKFDSSHDRGQPAEFPVNGIIKGWQEALQMMRKGAVYRLHIPPELAYGPQGQPGIPPFSALIFDVELIDIVK